MRRRPTGSAAALAAWLSLAGCADDGSNEPPRPVTEPEAQLRAVARDGGGIDLRFGAETIVRAARAEVLVGEDTLAAAEPCPEGCPAGADGALAVAWSLTEWEGGLRIDLSLRNDGDAPVTVLRMTPLITDGPDGGLFLGRDPRRHRVLDNGSQVALDSDSKLHQPDEGRMTVVDAILAVAPPRGNVVANWNHAVSDLDSGRTWVAGALVAEHAVPLMGTAWDPGAPPVEAEDGRRGFGLLAADQVLAFDGKVVAPGERLEAEPVFATVSDASPHEALARYASAIGAFHGRRPWWADGRPVPNGWNSWGGGGGSGGMGTTIDAVSMGENLDVMARELAPFGMAYFQIDDGYQVARGDWRADPARFPDGMAAFGDRVRAEGLVYGLWNRVFTVSPHAALAAEHPEWLVDESDAVFNAVLGESDGSRQLDLSNPEALAWIEDVSRRYREDYGVGWLKHDFAYQAFPYRARAVPATTAVEAYKAGLRAVRRGLGDDVFYLGVGLLGLNYGVVDSMRTTLDAGPVWEERHPFDLAGGGNNFKSTVKTAARRYYLHGPVWVNHHDLIFFRTEPGAPEVTPAEAITYASFMGLTGSIVKLGEDLRTLTPAHLDVCRRLLPSYPATARPLDLFTRHYPEVYRLDVDGTLAGSDARWTVLGLLHWGRNYDWTTRPEPTELPDDVPRSYQLAPADLGLDPDAAYLAQEHWTERFMGVVPAGDPVRVTLPPHDHAVIALRPATGHPQLLGHNRHFTQGGTDLVEEAWDRATRTLRLTLDLSAAPPGATPFEYRIRVYAPPGYVLTGTGADALGVPGATAGQEGRVVTITLTPASAGAATFVLGFAGP